MWQEFLEREFLGRPAAQWLMAAGVTLVVWLGLLALRWTLQKGVGQLVKRTAIAWDDILAELIRRTHGLFLFGLAVLGGASVLKVPPALVGRGLAVILVLQGGLWASLLVRLLGEQYRERKLREDPGAAASLHLAFVSLRVLVWVLAVLLLLANLGIDITTLVAGLGVGGIAVALAVQTVLKDLLASLSIALDKPFIVGDFLAFGEFMGTVEHIGIKSTRVRSLTGEQLVFSNNDLLEGRIRNYGRMRERRVAFTLGVTYDTPREKLRRIPELIRQAIEAQELTRFDRSHFKSYGDFALLFETVYYLAVPDYNRYMDVQQAINLAIHEAFEREGIEFAFPTQTIHLAGGLPVQAAPSQPETSPSRS